MLQFLFLFTAFVDIRCQNLPPRVSQPREITCDCIRIPGTNQCLKYDNRLQAKTLDEAMGFFEDLSLLGEIKPAQKLNRDSTTKCTTKQCQICRKMLASKLKTVGLLQFIHEVSGQELTQENLTESCVKYRFARKNSDTVDYKTIANKKSKEDSDSSSSEEEKTQKIDKRQSVTNNLQTKDGKDLAGFIGSLFGRKKRGANEVFSSESIEDTFRSKRAASPSDPDFIGTRYYLSCTEKGTPDETGLLSLCTRCWAWRELPPEYFPRYVNELVCHSNDTGCLSGYATCGSGTQQLDVLRNDSGTLVPISLAASTYCECQIKAGSTLEPLVFGDASTSPLPGIPAANGVAPPAA